MRTITTFLIIVFELFRVGVVGTSRGDLNEEPCRARAWVRAPDLEAGQVVQGDVKVKLDGACDEVSSYTLGLRFAERSWVKTRREGVALPVNPRENQSLARPIQEKTHSNHSDIYENKHIGWRSWTLFPEIDQSAWDQYDTDIQNPALWLVREEERIAFETRYKLFDEPGQKSSRDIVKSFALLVPCTMYPPAFDTTFSTSSIGVNTAGGEHVYKYFVDVTFLNGTHREVEAGYTSFNSAVDVSNETISGVGGHTSFNIVPASARGSESVNVTATRFSNKKLHPESSLETNTSSRDIFTLEIMFPNGRHLEQGSMNNVTIVFHQLGPGLQRPLNIQYLSVNTKQRRTWAANHAADNETAEELLHSGTVHTYELRPKADDQFTSFRDFDWDTRLPQFSQEGVVEAGTEFSTEAVIAQLEIPRQNYPPFDMYYESSEVELMISVQVRNVTSDQKSGASMPDDYDEEYDWTPFLREQPHLGTEILQANVPIFVYRKPEHHGTLAVSRVVHYLSPEARAPTFVDPSSLPRLQELSAEDRDNLAPLAQPRFSAKAGGDVVTRRYYGGGEYTIVRQGVYYVGNTWLRKVLSRGENRLGDDALSGTLVVQA